MLLRADEGEAGGSDPGPVACAKFETYIAFYFRMKAILNNVFLVGKIQVCFLRSSDQLFHNFKAPKSGDRQTKCSSESTCDRFRDIKIVKGSVRQK